jgi:hypothetical protein
MKSLQHTTLLLTAGLAVACQKGPVDIGDPMVGAKLTDYVGTWSGYAEAYAFSPSGSDRLRLVIDPSGSGTVEYGDGPLIPTATDPTAGYPPDYQVRYGEWDFAGITDVTEGFRYPLHDAQIDSGRLRFGIFPKDLFAQWCALQTPLAVTGDVWSGRMEGYSCVHEDWRNWRGTDGGIPTECDQLSCCWSFKAPDDTVSGMDCARAYVCKAEVGCVCTAASCSVGAPAPGQQALNQYPVYFDTVVATGATRLDGTMVIAGTTTETAATRINVRLQRN